MPENFVLLQIDHLHFFNSYQVRYSSDHTTYCWVIFFDNRLFEFAKSKCYNSLRCDGMRPIET